MARAARRGEDLPSDESDLESADEDVDLSDGDWADYDVEADAPVALSDIETKVELVR